jgi:hypothetical protein
LSQELPTLWAFFFFDGYKPKNINKKHGKKMFSQLTKVNWRYWRICPLDGFSTHVPIKPSRNPEVAIPIPEIAWRNWFNPLRNEFMKIV